ncbi:MAG: choice-of-anchor A family protein [Ancrocorticia sp.]|jgi:choice-of-anchor A domain-containing protein/LPXTG-motif cell wall-anchored protein|nr:choice-of-anchor A family protein [Ancrocorticia sp.]
MAALTRRIGAYATVLGTAFGLIATAPVFASPVAPTALAASTTSTGGCPSPGDMPTIGNSPVFTDQNVAVFAGGDYLATGNAAETEGLLVVAGDASFTRDGLFNIDSVGVGSGITPAGGTPMLQVGGALFIDSQTRVSVGANVTGGGGVLVAEERTGSGMLDLNGGTLTENLGYQNTLDPYASFGTDLADVSHDLAAMPATGTVAPSGGSVDFIGSDNETMEIFEISAATLSSARWLNFTNIAQDTPILINVTDSGVVVTNIDDVRIDDVRVDDLQSSDCGNAASQIMWNLPTTNKLTIGGTSQFMGSVMAPRADANVTASTNGRLLVGGDITTNGSGNEHHNYPWIAASLTSCVPELSPQPLQSPTTTPTPDQPTTTPTPDQPTTTSTPDQPTTTPTPDRPTTMPSATVTTSAASVTTTPDADTTSSNGNGTLPNTGSNSRPLGIIALLFLGAGAALLIVERRSTHA